MRATAEDVPEGITPEGKGRVGDLCHIWGSDGLERGRRTEAQITEELAGRTRDYSLLSLSFFLGDEGTLASSNWPHTQTHLLVITFGG